MGTPKVVLAFSATLAICACTNLVPSRSEAPMTTEGLRTSGLTATASILGATYRKGYAPMDYAGLELRVQVVNRGQRSVLVSRTPFEGPLRIARTVEEMQRKQYVYEEIPDYLWGDGPPLQNEVIGSLVLRLEPGESATMRVFVSVHVSHDNQFHWTDLLLPGKYVMELELCPWGFDEPETARIQAWFGGDAEVAPRSLTVAPFEFQIPAERELEERDVRKFLNSPLEIDAVEEKKK